MGDYEVFVGIDWATERHELCALDATGRVLATGSVPHSGAGMAELRARLGRLRGDAARIAVGIELPRGAIVDALLAQGCHVFAINPKQVDRFRDRYTVAGAKDDRRDAFVLADVVRTDRAAFRRVDPEDPRLIELREMSRIHDELGQEHTRLANRLREQLLRFYPQALTLCPAADEAWLWTLLERAPTPAAATRLRLRTLRTLLAAHRIRRVTAEALHQSLAAPPLPVAPGVAEAATAHLTLLLPRLRLVRAQRAHCDRQLETLLAALAEPARPEHRDVTILRSLPGVGRVVAATMLAEAAQPLAARDYQTLRTYAGVAPVTRQSGKARWVIMRRACNVQLRQAVFQWAANSIRLDAHCRAHYDRLRQRHGHARALRGVGDRLLRVLIAMLIAGTVYKPPDLGAQAA